MTGWMRLCQILCRMEMLHPGSLERQFMTSLRQYSPDVESSRSRLRMMDRQRKKPSASSEVAHTSLGSKEKFNKRKKLRKRKLQQHA